MADQTEKLKEIGVHKLMIGGGEPFCRLDFVEVLEHADRLGLAAAVATNGTLISAATCDRMARLSRLKLLVSLRHHLHGPHDKFCRVAGGFGRTMAAMKLLRSSEIRLAVLPDGTHAAAITLTQ